MAEQSEGSQGNSTNEEVWKGSDEIFLGMNEEEESDGDGDGDRDSVSGEPKYIQIDSETDIWNLKIDMLTPKEIKALDFLDVEVAYKFYNEYGRVKGFSIRKHKTYNDYKGDLLWKSFAVYAARCTLGRSPYWTETLKHYTGYSEEQLRDCSKHMVNFHSAAPESKLRAVYKKFSSSERSAVALVTPAKNLLAPQQQP